MPLIICNTVEFAFNEIVAATKLNRYMKEFVISVKSVSEIDFAIKGNSL